MKITVARNLFFFTPHCVIFLLITYWSMESASDRQQYLYLFEDPYGSTRFEYLFVMLAKIFHFFGFRDVLSILIMQSATFTLYFFTWNQLSRTRTLISLSFFGIILVTVFASIIGVQIRYGLAVALAICVYSQVMNKNHLYKILYIIPAFIHYGTLPFLFLAIISDFKQCMKKRKLILLLLCISILLGISFSQLFYVLNLPYYYKPYFDGTYKNSPGPSLTMMYYFFVLASNYFFDGKKVNWLPYSGLIFGIAAIYSEIDLLLKLMIPFVLLSTLDFFNHMHRIKIFTKEMTLIFYPLSYFSFFYLVRMVGL